MPRTRWGGARKERREKPCCACKQGAHCQHPTPSLQEHLVQDQKALHRSDFFPGLGWLTTAGVWASIRDDWCARGWGRERPRRENLFSCWQSREPVPPPFSPLHSSQATRVLGRLDEVQRHSSGQAVHTVRGDGACRGRRGWYSGPFTSAACPSTTPPPSLHTHTGPAASPQTGGLSDVQFRGAWVQQGPVLPRLHCSHQDGRRGG